MHVCAQCPQKYLINCQARANFKSQICDWERLTVFSQQPQQEPWIPENSSRPSVNYNIKKKSNIVRRIIRWVVYNQVNQLFDWRFLFVGYCPGHRRTGNFLPEGAVNHSCKLPKFLQNRRTETRAIRCNNMGRTSIWKWLDTVFQGQYLWSFFEYRLRHHKQTVGKIASTVVLDKNENLLWSGLQ